MVVPNVRALPSHLSFAGRLSDPQSQVTVTASEAQCVSLTLMAATFCRNPAGFGYTSEGGNQCPPDHYTAKDSMSPCEPCPAGRITAYEPGVGELQDSILDCK